MLCTSAPRKQSLNRTALSRRRSKPSPKFCLIRYAAFFSVSSISYANDAVVCAKYAARLTRGLTRVHLFLHSIHSLQAIRSLMQTVLPHNAGIDADAVKAVAACAAEFAAFVTAEACDSTQFLANGRSDSSLHWLRYFCLSLRAFTG